MAAHSDVPTPGTPPEDPSALGGPEGTRRREVAARIRASARDGAADQLARLAARVLDAGSAHISILGEDQQIIGAHGLTPDVLAPMPIADSLCGIAAAGGGTLVIDDAATDPRVSDLPPVTSGTIGTYLGVALRVEDVVVGALCVHGPEARTWTPEERALLGQLAVSVETELQAATLTSELAESAARLDLGFEAAGIGSFDWDLTSGELRFDARLNELFGFSESEPITRIEQFDALVHPDDRDRVSLAITDAIERCSTYKAEYRIVLAGGRQVWISASGRVLGDPGGTPVRMLGAAHDTSGAHAGAERLSRVLETLTTGFYALDPEWRFTYVNAAAEQLLGRPRGELLGGIYWELYPDLDDTTFGRMARHAVATGEAVTFEDRYVPLAVWFEVTLAPGTEGLSVFFRDVGARHEAETESARATERLRMIATASAELSTTPDIGVAVGRFARLIVPLLTDWCLVTLLLEDGRIEVVGAWHHDPERQGEMTRFADSLVRTLTPESTIMRALHSGEPVVQRGLSTAGIADHLTEEGRGLAHGLGTDAVATIPLVARGRTLGTFSLVNGIDRGAHTPAELTAATELAVRAALAVDNAGLHAAERRMSEVLQRSMLSEPPAPDHLHIVTRYRPAEDHAQVGGDWYDSFLQPDGTTMVVIGDVMGHDISAAAAMGQLRTMVRTVASDRGAPPAEVLSRVDRSLRTLGIDTFATVAIAQVVQSRSEAARGERRIRWASAGHLPPLLRGPDGVVRPLVASGVVLGVQVDAPRRDQEVVVEPGSVLLLYTDGLVERRGEVIDLGIERLMAALQAADGAVLDDLCDEVLAAMLPDGAEDDVALVAMRLFSEEGARPAEAGPEELPEAFEEGGELPESP